MTTTNCDNHAKQVRIPTPDGGAVWICEGCMEICGDATPETVAR